MDFKNKYRPKRFEDCIGRQAIAEARGLLSELPLKVSIIEDYGGGKTTMGCLLTKGVFCEALPEKRPCGICPSCEFIDETWWGAGRICQGMHPARRDRHDYYEVLDMGTASPQHLINLRDKWSIFTDLTTLYVFDELHLAKPSTQKLLLKLLETQLRFSVIFCIAKVKDVTQPLMKRTYPFEIPRPEIEEFLPRIRFIADAEHIPIIDASAPEELVEGCSRVLRDVMTGLGLVANFRQGFSSETVKRALRRIRLMGEGREKATDD